MAAMVEEDSWDTGREKKRTRMKKSKEPKGEVMEWACPACAQGVRYPERLARHMVRCCPELCAASTDGPLGQARAVAGRIPKELRTRAAPEDPGEAERHGLCWRDLRARPNKAGPMTPDEERRAREALAFAVAREDEIRSAASFLAFHLSSDGADVDSESEFKVQQTPVTLSLPRRIERVREHLSLGTDRLTKMLKLYIRSEPLVADDAGDFDLVYEDDVWLCANKPPFVRTAPRHRFEGNSMVNRAIGYVRGKSGAQDGPPQENPRVLHRLDMDTSGVLLYSKDRDVAAHVQGLFRERKVSKKYLCICCGDPPPHFVVDTALERMEDHEVAMRVVPSGRETSQSKPSKTLFVTVARSPKGLSPVGARPSELHPYDLAKVGLDRGTCASFCLICAIPLTGRTHQIRLHVASAGFPIVGDPLYGALSDELMPRQALHAFKLTLGGLPEGVSQPGTGFLAPLPRDMASCLGRLGMECKSVEEIDSIVRATPFQEGEGKS